MTAASSISAMRRTGRRSADTPARRADLDASLDAVRQGGYEITRPATPLDLVNTTTGKPFRIRVAFFRGPDGEDVELLEDTSGET